MAAVPGEPCDTTSDHVFRHQCLDRSGEGRPDHQRARRATRRTRARALHRHDRASCLRARRRAREAPAGTYVFVEPAVKRTAFAEEPGTTIVSVGGVPGQAYEPSGWEVWSPVRNLYEAGEYEAVIERGRELIEANPQYSLPLQPRVLRELTGRKEDALAHLRQAVGKSGRLRAYAKEDSDFDAIREEPAFKEMIGPSRAAPRPAAEPRRRSRRRGSLRGRPSRARSPR